MRLQNCGFLAKVSTSNDLFELEDKLSDIQSALCTTQILAIYNFNTHYLLMPYYPVYKYHSIQSKLSNTSPSEKKLSIYLICWLHSLLTIYSSQLAMLGQVPQLINTAVYSMQWMNSSLLLDQVLFKLNNFYFQDTRTTRPASKFQQKFIQ